MEQYAQKKLIIFDLDDTLAPSKSPIDAEMAGLLVKLLAHKKVAVMSGGSLKQLELQILQNLSCTDTLLGNFFLFPTCATSFLRHQNGSWHVVYKEELGAKEKQTITKALEVALLKIGLPSEKIYGTRIEDRGTQVTFSGLGQDAPLALKRTWDTAGEKRRAVTSILEGSIPEYAIRIAGTTSIDITRKGIHKGYGVAQIEKHLGVSRDEMLFIGDALSPEGNDYPVKEAGVLCVEVSGPEETKKIIRIVLSTTAGR
ncbi:MAG: hypothetical protein A2756_01715 [Candidatus Ryanbacteria bacterium RIFCSPHIGHO2_01_FULL_48_27]|uniref:phosphomannomutase n=1 Tax=Candidatus Ryanbacteria bacterium RIFCSPHIGHO2_01_FULL_48_27 TaxID=1802115 RepID=A0A1G2G2N2_9BACT|nr:MAG: hypothetical protein A2756_01715 [Candidatus Ryanbacteria bacterium RIFCSPHIGHO2_01_FULL_48_27]